MNDNLRETIINCFTDVIEKMAFMFVEEAEEDEMDADGALKAQMKFSGERGGSLMIAFSHETVNNLASNVVGADPEDKNIDNLRSDALSELLNVTCGNMLTAYFGDTPVFDLGVPEVSTINAGQWKKLIKSPDVISLLVEENPAAIQFIVK